MLPSATGTSKQGGQECKIVSVHYVAERGHTCQLNVGASLFIVQRWVRCVVRDELIHGIHAVAKLMLLLCSIPAGRQREAMAPVVLGQGWSLGSKPAMMRMIDWHGGAAMPVTYTLLLPSSLQSSTLSPVQVALLVPTPIAPCCAVEPVDRHLQLHWQLFLDALLLYIAWGCIHFPGTSAQWGESSRGWKYS